jgi:hypothetical protein
MDIKDWDLGLFKKMEELKKRHRLDCSGGAASFNLNSDLADRAYEPPRGCRESPIRIQDV